MQKEEYSILSHDEKHTPLHCVYWAPDRKKDYKAVLLIFHGMVEYIERYEEFAQYLAKRGFVVAGHDHIGHGDSVAGHGDWGKMHTNHPSDTMVDDMYTHFVYVREHFKDLPIFVLGHSMGSYLLRKMLSKKAEWLEGLCGAIIMGTGTESEASISAGKVIVKSLMRIHGRDHYSRFVRNNMYGKPYKQFDIDGIDATNSWLTKDVDKVKEYYSNPKTTFNFSLNGYKALLEACGYDNSMRNIRKIPKNLPILFASGTCDPVGNMGEGVRAAFQKFWDAGIKDVGIELYENDRHEILNETDRDVVYEDLYNWMMERMPAKDNG